MNGNTITTYAWMNAFNTYKILTLGTLILTPGLAQIPGYFLGGKTRLLGMTFGMYQIVGCFSFMIPTRSTILKALVIWSQVVSIYISDLGCLLFGAFV
jgi:hypothetical protein